ncbi:MAG: hypothetical protein ABII88_10990 [Candidatus Omnitrophota bacterium]
MNKKILFIVLTSFLVGLIIGALGVSIYSGKTIGNIMSVSGLHFRADWSERAFQAYKNEDPKVAIWSLENFAKILEEHEKLYIKDKKIIQADIVLTYTRLAILFKDKKDDIKYKEYISKALNISREAYPDVKTEEDLLSFLKKIDSIKQK